jgi:hypothetical protein
MAIASPRFCLIKIKPMRALRRMASIGIAAAGRYSPSKQCEYLQAVPRFTGNIMAFVGPTFAALSPDTQFIRAGMPHA